MRAGQSSRASSRPRRARAAWKDHTARSPRAASIRSAAPAVGAPKISALDASTKCARDASARIASSMCTVPRPFTSMLPTGSRNDAATLDCPARWNIASGAASASTARQASASSGSSARNARLVVPGDRELAQAPESVAARIRIGPMRADDGDADAQQLRCQQRAVLAADAGDQCAAIRRASWPAPRKAAGGCDRGCQRIAASRATQARTECRAPPQMRQRRRARLARDDGFDRVCLQPMPHALVEGFGLDVAHATRRMRSDDLILVPKFDMIAFVVQVPGVVFHPTLRAPRPRRERAGAGERSSAAEKMRRTRQSSTRRSNEYSVAATSAS